MSDDTSAPPPPPVDPVQLQMQRRQKNVTPQSSDSAPRTRRESPLPLPVQQTVGDPATDDTGRAVSPSYPALASPGRPVPPPSSLSARLHELSVGSDRADPLSAGASSPIARASPSHAPNQSSDPRTLLASHPSWQGTTSASERPPDDDCGSCGSHPRAGARFCDQCGSTLPRDSGNNSGVARPDSGQGLNEADGAQHRPLHFSDRLQVGGRDRAPAPGCGRLGREVTACAQEIDWAQVVAHLQQAKRTAKSLAAFFKARAHLELKHAHDVAKLAAALKANEPDSRSGADPAQARTRAGRCLTSLLPRCRSLNAFVGRLVEAADKDVQFCGVYQQNVGDVVASLERQRADLKAYAQAVNVEHKAALDEVRAKDALFLKASDRMNALVKTVSNERAPTTPTKNQIASFIADRNAKKVEAARASIPTAEREMVAAKEAALVQRGYLRTKRMSLLEQVEALDVQRMQVLVDCLDRALQLDGALLRQRLAYSWDLGQACRHVAVYDDLAAWVDRNGAATAQQKKDAAADDGSAKVRPRAYRTRCQIRLTRSVTGCRPGPHLELMKHGGCVRVLLGWHCRVSRRRRRRQRTSRPPGPWRTGTPSGASA